MAVYGRIEEVSETIQSNEIENRWIGILNHVEKRRAGSFPVFQTHHWKYDLQRFFCGASFTFRYGKSFSGSGFVYRVGFASGRQLTVAIMLVKVFSITFTALPLPKEASFLLW